MSGGSQHNPNGRQSQLGAGWSPLQLQVASYLARAPQAHMASERGVTWHTPTPPHLYHVPAPSPPDPLQAMKASAAAGNSVFRHTATPPELYRHTPTPPDKHLLRHTPSPGDIKTGPVMPPAELYPHLGPARDKIVRPDELGYNRNTGGGVDLSLGRAPIALSVRDAPTINSLIARAAPRHGRVDALLERLAPVPPAPASPHSVIVHPRAAATPSPPSSNEDSADSCGAPPGSKRKRKPERTVRLTKPQPPPEPIPEPPPAAPVLEPHENGEHNGPELPHTRRKTRSGSAETIDDIAALIANPHKTTDVVEKPPEPPVVEPEAPLTVDKLKSVLGSPEVNSDDAKDSPKEETPVVEAAAAPKRRSARISNSESTNVPVESPSEAKPAEPEASEAKSAEPVPASIVEVENQLEKLFAGIDEEAPVAKEVPNEETSQINTDTPVVEPETPKGKKRRKSTISKVEKGSRRSSRASTGDESPKKKKPARKKSATKQKKAKDVVKDAYDSGSNASSSRSRGPYIQIRGPRDSPLSVAVVNAGSGGVGEEECETRREYRNGARARGLHCSTLGLRYDASTPDASWVCAFCERGPHKASLGDLFGPYWVEASGDEWTALDEVTRRRYNAGGAAKVEVWVHGECALWAPGVLAAGARLWGLGSAVWAARGAACPGCGARGAALACAHPQCRQRAHLPCARANHWHTPEDFRALCPLHKP